MIPFFTQNSFYYAVYNKNSNESNIYTSKEFEKIINIPFLSPPISVIDDNFVSVIYNIDEMKKTLEINNKKRGLAELKRIIENSSVDDNPILIYYTFEQRD